MQITRLIRLAGALFAVLVVLGALSLLPGNQSPAEAAPSCVNDDRGANDVPGQKDLTQMCFEAPVSGSQSITWNWDELGTSGNNTLDACALFDTDGDGKANYAVCGVTLGNPAAVQDTITYTCNDTRSDRCSGKQLASGQASNCTVAQTGTDPFAAGAGYPQDTTATCNVVLADVGTTSSVLLNVCSYPSGEPNSDPSDCVVVPDLPRLTLVKTVTNDNGGTALATAWTLVATGPQTISGATGTAAVTTAAVATGTYALSETGGPTGYTAGTYSCVKNSGSAVVANSITLAFGDVATCTINNNDQAPQLHLRKVVVNDNGGTALNTAWTLTATGALATPTNLSGTTPVDSTSSFKADTYTLAETGGPSNYTASVWSCGLTGTSTQVTVTSSQVTIGLGQNVTCTITNDDNINPTSLSTGPSVRPQDSATVSASAGGNVAGSVIFSLYDSSANCTAGTATGRLYTETVNLPGTATSSTVSTNNTTYAISAAGPTTVWWRVSFTSTNASQSGRNSYCTEQTTISNVVDAGPGTAP